MTTHAAERLRPGAYTVGGTVAVAEAVDWSDVTESLNTFGVAVIPNLLTESTCQQLASLYRQDGLFRNRVVMSRQGFGRGEYKYFSYPLPPTIARLRSTLYPHLAAIADRWSEQLGDSLRFPASHAQFLERCRAAGQCRPTPLLLAYGEGDYNCLHQDLYGEHVFPLQVAILLSKPGEDFAGGELVLTEQRPRMQSRPEVVPLRQGDAAVFAVSHRPVRGSRGIYRVNHRHGVSRIRRGSRYTLGIIFHDAK
jgi:uncharacterized protein